MVGDPQREDWAVRMLRSAHLLKGAGRVDWKTLAGTAKAVLDGRALHRGVCLGEDQRGSGERGTATRTQVSGWTS